jgi:dephospho-CoA kinase
MGPGANLIIGLTGGMGCGKSTAAAFFAEQGFRRLDADRVVREELLTAPEVIMAIRDRFGPGVLDAEGRVARDRLAGVVFNDPAALDWLEKLLHPRLRARWKALIDAAHGEKFIVEVPLLFENGMENWFDFTVCVSTDSTLQLQRLEQRGIPPELARQRLARQWPLTRKCELADFVLHNDGSPEFLREQVNALIPRLTSTRPSPSQTHGSSSSLPRGQ